MAPSVLAELVIRVSSTRLRLVVADAVFRRLCCSNGLTVGDDDLSLKKMVSTPIYLLIHWRGGVPGGAPHPKSFLRTHTSSFPLRSKPPLGNRRAML